MVVYTKRPDQILASNERYYVPSVEHATLMRVFRSGVPRPVTGSQSGVAFQLACGTIDARPPTSEYPVQPTDPPSKMSVRPVWLSE